MSFCQFSGRPMSSVLWNWLKGFDYNRFDYIIADSSNSSRTRRIYEPIKTFSEKAVAPLRRRHRMDAKLSSYLTICTSLATCEHDATVQSKGLSRCVRRRAQRSSVGRSLPVKMISTVGRPLRVIGTLLPSVLLRRVCR